MTNAEYHADKTHVSSTKLKVIYEKSPAHYKAMQSEESAAMAFGTMFHTFTLEADVFEAEYFLFDDAEVLTRIGGKNPRATKAYKEWKAEILDENEGMKPVSADEYERLQGMKNAIFENPSAAVLLKNVEVEKAIFTTCPRTQMPVKVRPDAINNEYSLIIDLKSTDDASPEGFARSCSKYNYGLSDAFYCDMHEAAGLGHIEKMIFIAVEKTPPYAVGVYSLCEDSRRIGREAYLYALNKLKESRRLDIWPGYGDEIVEISLPGYTFKKHELKLHHQ